MKIAVIGSRKYSNLQRVKEFIKNLPWCETTIISGGAKGVDTAAEQTAKEMGMEVIIHLADWARFGRSAGFVRNRAIVESADKIVAFWDGKSNGTRHGIELAKKLNKPWVIFYD